MGLVWRSARGSLRGSATRLHVVVPGRAGPERSGGRAARSDIWLLDPVQSEVPELGIICREGQTSVSE